MSSNLPAVPSQPSGTGALAPRGKAAALPPEIISAIAQHPEKADKIADAYVTASLSNHPALFTAYTDSKRRVSGMWVGAGLSVVSLAGGVAVLVGSAPAAIGVALLGVGAACAGGTFAVITGRNVSPKEFAMMLNVFRRGKN